MDNVATIGRLLENLFAAAEKYTLNPESFTDAEARTMLAQINLVKLKATNEQRERGL